MSKRPVFPNTFDGLKRLTEQLRGKNGCPWDKDQTHVSLKRNLLEECYEVLEAIDQNEPQKLREELGDLLFQIVFHCCLAEETGAFTTEQVFHDLNKKLVRRHPHVFGNGPKMQPREIEEKWDAQKRAERGGKSSLDRVPLDLPALAYSQIIQDRAARTGFDWDSIDGVLEKLKEEIVEFQTTFSEVGRHWEMGDIFFSLVNLARWMDIHAEDSLRQANVRFFERFSYMERRCQEEGRLFADLPHDAKETLWKEAKEVLD
jgi:tetrapyrrole methylase family protein/MazG family protein